MRKILQFTGFLFCLVAVKQNIFAQGCVAVRHMSCAAGSGANASSMMRPGQWQVSMGVRNFDSHRHFVGTEYQEQRLLNDTEVKNHSQGFDIGVTYSLTDRLSVSLNIPIAINVRESKYEHYGNGTTAAPTPYFSTKSSGLGDMRLGINYWLLDPLKNMDGNVSLGLGIKAPTGNSNVQDGFHKLDKEGKDYLQYRAVDQSIQLGDGGWGVNIEIQGYQKLFTKASLYYNAFYLFNPQNTNNTYNSISQENVQNPITVKHSIADQFAARAGVGYALIPKAGISVSLGGRIEGVPSEDVFGKSEGFRRPGYIISIEPGIAYMNKHNTFALNVPIATTRNRTRSYSDLKYGGQGDAAFADYLISVTLSHRF
ncbi:MAG: hypothetical protein V4585_22060 [Bacteroidota bacterium]